MVVLDAPFTWNVYKINICYSLFVGYDLAMLESEDGFLNHNNILCHFLCVSPFDGSVFEIGAVIFSINRLFDSV